MNRARGKLVALIYDGPDLLTPPRQIVLVGRFAQTIRALVANGQKGVTALEMSSWALRLGHYVWVLRHRHNIAIETRREPHDGGEHARYVLRSRVTIASDERAAA